MLKFLKVFINVYNIHKWKYTYHKCRAGELFPTAHIHVGSTQVKQQKFTHTNFFNSCIFQMLSFQWLLKSWKKKKNQKTPSS